MGPAEVGKDSVATLRDALARYEKIGPSDRLATIRLCLANILRRKKKLAQAEPLLLDASADLANRPAKLPEAATAVLNSRVMLRFAVLNSLVSCASRKDGTRNH